MPGRGGGFGYESDGIPVNENSGHSVKDFVEKMGSLGVGSKKGPLFWCDDVNLPK